MGNVQGGIEYIETGRSLRADTSLRLSAYCAYIAIMPSLMPQSPYQMRYLGHRTLVEALCSGVRRTLHRLHSHSRQSLGHKHLAGSAEVHLGADSHRQGMTAVEQSLAVAMAQVLPEDGQLLVDIPAVQEGSLAAGGSLDVGHSQAVATGCLVGWGAQPQMGTQCHLHLLCPELAPGGTCPQSTVGSQQS